MDEKLDLRIVKTRKALVESLFTLLCEKRFEDITISALCDRAMVRRATFYKHFSDKYDLFSYTISTLFHSFPASQALSEHPTGESYVALAMEVIDFLSVHRRLVQSVLKSNLISNLIDIISKEISKALPPVCPEGAEYTERAVAAEVATHFYISAVMGTILWWLRQKPTISKEELSKHLKIILEQQQMGLGG